MVKRIRDSKYALTIYLYSDPSQPLDEFLDQCYFGMNLVALKNDITLEIESNISDIT